MMQLYGNFSAKMKAPGKYGDAPLRDVHIPSYLKEIIPILKILLLN